MLDDGRLLLVLALGSVSLVSLSSHKLTGSRGVVRSRGPSKPKPPRKLTSADFRPRTKPGFYRRPGGPHGGPDVLRVEDVGCMLRDEPLRPSDWFILATSTLTDPGPTGPSTPGTPSAHVEMKVHELHQAGYRRIKREKLSPAWRAWFDAHPP